jgi:hypothetical protein
VVEYGIVEKVRQTTFYLRSEGPQAGQRGIQEQEIVLAVPPTVSSSATVDDCGNVYCPLDPHHAVVPDDEKRGVIKHLLEGLFECAKLPI